MWHLACTLSDRPCHEIIIIIIVFGFPLLLAIDRDVDVVDVDVVAHVVAVEDVVVLVAYVVATT